MLLWSPPLCWGGHLKIQLPLNHPHSELLLALLKFERKTNAAQSPVQQMVTITENHNWSTCREQLVYHNWYIYSTTPVPKV